MTGAIVGSDAVQDVQGGVTAAQFPLPLSERIGRSATAEAYHVAAFGMVDAYEQSQRAQAEPMMAPDDVEKYYGFRPTKPMHEATASVLAESNEAQERADSAYRNAQGAGRWGAQLTGGMAGAMIDPTNIALLFMPEIGLEGSLAKKLGFAVKETEQGARVINPLARAVTRAGVGGPLFATLNAPFEASDILEKEKLGIPYSFKDSLRDVAFNFALGTLAHPVVGAFGDAFHSMRMARLETKITALQQTLGAAMNDAPIEASSAFEHGGLTTATSLTHPAAMERLWGAETKEDFVNALQEMHAGDLSPETHARIDKLFEVRAKLGNAQAEVQSFGDTLDSVHRDLLRALPESERIGLVDPVSGERLRAIDSELGGTIPAARRQALMDERRMIMEGGAFSKAEIAAEVAARSETLEGRQQLLGAEMERQKSKANRYQEEGQKRLSKMINNLKIARDNGTIMGSTQAEVAQYKDIRRSAVKDFSEKPQMPLEDLKSLNAELQNFYGEHMGEPEFQAAMDLDQDHALYEAAARAGTICLGRP